MHASKFKPAALTAVALAALLALGACGKKVEDTGASPSTPAPATTPSTTPSPTDSSSSMGTSTTGSSTMGTSTTSTSPMGTSTSPMTGDAATPGTAASAPAK